MLESERCVRSRLHTSLEIALIPVSFYPAILLSSALGKDQFMLSDFAGVLQLPIFLAIMAYAAVLGTDTKLYASPGQKFMITVRNMAWAIVRGGLLFLALLFLFDRVHIGRTTYLLQAGSLLGLFLCERALLDWIQRSRRCRGVDIKTVMVVGTGPTAQKFVSDAAAHPEWCVQVLGFLDWGTRPVLWRFRDIPLLGQLEDLPHLVLANQVDYVLFAVPRNEMDRMEDPIRTCDETGTPAVLLADFFVPKIANTRIEEFNGRPVVLYAPTPQREFSILAKDIFDRIAALLGLVTVFPILVGAALAIKLEDRGPILFSQLRCGKNGRRFRLYKFRSMVLDAERRKSELKQLNEMNGAAFKMKDDPRITRVGRFLRSSSIDELPQLWNVARGQMSLVGPRPPLPDEVACFDKWQRRKLSMKPGITGLWQVGGRSDVDFEEWMKMDLQYIDEWSLGLDAKILAKTIPAVISTKGAR